MRKPLEITILSAPVPPPDPIEIVTESPLPDGQVDAAYSETLDATGGSGSYVYSLHGTLPEGLVLSAGGRIFGVPTTPGTMSFEVEVTDVPVTQPEPDPVTDEPVFDPSTGTMQYEDDMDAYTDVVSMGALPPGGAARIVPHPSPVTRGKPVDTDHVSLVSPGRGGSGKALRIQYDGGEGKEGGTFLLQNPPVVATEATHFFQYYARINLAEPTPHSIAVKWFMAWHKNDGGNGRMQWHTHNRLPCTEIGAHGTYWQVAEMSRGTGCQATQPVGPYFTEDLDDNQWHRYTYQYKPHSSAGARDGVARMWIDGTKIIDISEAAVGVTPPGGEKTWCEQDDLDAIEVANGIRTLHWGSVATAVTSAWTLDIDDFLWWTEE